MEKWGPVKGSITFLKFDLPPPPPKKLRGSQGNDIWKDLVDTKIWLFTKIPIPQSDKRKYDFADGTYWIGIYTYTYSNFSNDFKNCLNLEVTRYNEKDIFPPWWRAICFHRTDPIFPPGP